MTVLTWTWNDGSFNITTGIWNITIPASAEWILALYGQITTSNTTICNTANTTWQSSFGYEGFDNATACLDIPAAASLTITKTANPPILTVGQPVTFTITVTNNGPNTATGVFVTDKLPSGLTYQSSSATKGSYNSGTGIWTIGSMLNNTSETLTLIAMVGAQGSYENTATVGSESYNPNTGNNSSSATVVVQTPSGPSVEAAESTIPMQTTGIPLVGLIIAVLLLTLGYTKTKK